MSIKTKIVWHEKPGPPLCAPLVKIESHAGIDLIDRTDSDLTPIAELKTMNNDTPLSGEYSKQHINQSRGPAFKFMGRLLAEASFQVQSGHERSITMEIYETEGGAYVAVSIETPDNPDMHENIWGTVVEPIYKPLSAHLQSAQILQQGELAMQAMGKLPKRALPEFAQRERDELAMRCAVMDQFQWHHEARKMARRLKWKLVREIA